MSRKYAAEDTEALKQFVQEGYVIYEGVHNPTFITAAHTWIVEKLDHFMGLGLDLDINGWAAAIARAFERSTLYNEMLANPRLASLCEKYVGPDIAWMRNEGFFINVPSDKDPTGNKGHHTDVWTGTGTNTLFAITFFTDVDEYNGLSIYPGSHLQGLMRPLNRILSPGDQELIDKNYELKNLSNVKAGDIVLWHPLMIHSTTGHSKTNRRISMTSRFRSTETPMTTQERALGYRTIRVGPLNQVARLIGSDYMLPFRTIGGFVGVDRRMADTYNYSPFKVGIDYDKYL